MKVGAMLRRDFLTLGAAAAVGCATTRGVRKTAPLIIDAHCHAGKGLNYGKDDATAAPWTTFNDPDWTLRRMVEAGIDRAIIFPINNDTFDKANQEIAGYVRQHADRLLGFAKHHQVNEAGRIRALLTREVRELGLRGLKLHGPPTPEMLDAAAELRIPILSDVQHVSDLFPGLESHPQVDIILPHLGSFASKDWTQHVAAIAAAKRYPNLHVDTSSVVFFQYLERAVRELPAEKIIFGSDGPLVDARIELAKVRLLRLPPDAEAKLLSGNILRLLAKAAS
jgi:predicted TIM-barrel fold metal-dependent hydrolase